MAVESTRTVYFDTHAHLADPAFSDDVEAVLERARESGVLGIVAVGYDLATSEASVELAHRAGIWAAVGIHPNSASTASSDALGRIAELARDPRVVAVGETGLDYYRDRVPPAVQRRSFEAHLSLAAGVGKPVIVHDREAHEDVLQTLLDWVGPRGMTGSVTATALLHCFSGDLGMAEAAIEAGLFISFAGNLTYQSARGLAEVARQVNIDAVVLETDCPYLAPAPRRGGRNEPANVVLVAERLAALRGLPPAEAASLTSDNARRLFGLEAMAPVGRISDLTP